MAIFGWAFLIGVVAGLRSMTAPAAVSWAARLGWLHLENTWLAFLGLAATPYILSLLAIGELIADKLPQTPSRKAAMGFTGRVLSGALCGAALGATSQALLAAAWGNARRRRGDSGRLRVPRSAGKSNWRQRSSDCPSRGRNRDLRCDLHRVAICVRDNRGRAGLAECDPRKADHALRVNVPLLVAQERSSRLRLHFQKRVERGSTHHFRSSRFSWTSAQYPSTSPALIRSMRCWSRAATSAMTPSSALAVNGSR